MENPHPIQSVELVPDQREKKNFLGLSIFAGALYALPTMAIATFFSFVLLFVLWAALSVGPMENFFDSIDFSFLMGILLLISVLLALIPSAAIGIASGRMAYKRSNQEESGRRAGITMLTGSGVGLIGLIIFPILCYGVYFVLFFLTSELELYNSFIFGLLTGGSESGMSIILGACVPSIALLLAYFTALLSSWIVFRRRPPQSEPPQGSP